MMPRSAVLSITLTVLIVEIAVFYHPQSDWRVQMAAFPLGIVCGYLAPIARDILAAIQSLRGD